MSTNQILATIHNDYLPFLEVATDEELAQFVRAQIRQSSGEEVPELTGMSKALFEAHTALIERLEESRKKKSEAGKQGGNPQLKQSKPCAEQNEAEVKQAQAVVKQVEAETKCFNLPPVRYCFFNTGLEMEAIKRHVRDMEALYGVTITEHKPKKNIVTATREHGIPFISKIVSSGLDGIQRKNIPLSIAAEYADAEDKAAVRAELDRRYPRCRSEINFLCGCNTAGEPRPDMQLVINSSKYLLDFIIENPIPFKVSNKCCDYCKKNIAKSVQKPFDMVITGERRDEGGMRSVPRQGENTSLCFSETSDGKRRLKPLYYVSDADKQWYKDYYGIRYSDAYEVYGLTRTGCCGCSISSKAVEDLEKIRPYEPNLVKAAWNVFGDSYRYRKQYDEYRALRYNQEKNAREEEKLKESKQYMIVGFTHETRQLI